MKIRLILSITILLFSIYCFFYFLQSPTVYQLRSSIPGPSIIIIGGTHGNEPAGYVAAKQLYQYLLKTGIKQGTVTIIPDANRWGLKLNMRWLPVEFVSFGLLGGNDLNRSYPSPGEESPLELANEMAEMISKADWVIDLHEGYDFFKLNPNSMGSGIYPGKTKPSHELIPFLLQAVNRRIHNPMYQFVSTDWKDYKGTLRMFCNQRNINYLLVETSGQNDIQPLSIRVQQHLDIIIELLKQLNI